MNITKKIVPNHAVGRNGQRPDCVVIHIAEGLRDGVYSQFMTHEVSTHYLVNKDGSVWQFVEEEDTAWGNGNVSNPTSKLVQGRPGINPNLYTISIEHEGFSNQGDINELMYATTIQLVKDICTRWMIPMDAVHIIGHRDIYSIKTCPGPISVPKIITGMNQSPAPVTPAKQLVNEISERIEKLKLIV